MTYTSFYFMCFVALLGIIYFLTPQKYRYLVLLVFSGAFIYIAGGKSSVFFIYLTGLLAYVAAQLISKKKKIFLYITILFVLGCLGLLKYRSYLFPFGNSRLFSISVPIGISFYSMSVIAYLVDVYKHKIEPEKNLFKFLLYVTWFPHILQGPIARFDRLSESLFSGAKFDYTRVCHGLQLMFWGVAQKLIIADRAFLVVNEVFTNYGKYGSTEIIYAAVLYALELYADFAGCVNISIGVSEIFGIQLDQNFAQPYFAITVQDFWRRWHMTLSSFLRDYVYIPLGGKKKGIIRKYLNLMITFLVSGIWHGVGNHFIFWGIMHGVYQVAGNLTKGVREKCETKLHINAQTTWYRVLRIIGTFIWVDIAWIFFRADSISHGFRLLKNLFTRWNPWSLFNEGLFRVGLDRKETYLLLFFLILMFVFDYLHEKGIRIRKTIDSYALLVRWGIYMALLVSIILFGKYGYGFNAVDFIYMQF